MAPFASELSGGALSASGEQTDSGDPTVLCQVSVTGWLGAKPVPVTCVSVPSLRTAGFATIFGAPRDGGGVTGGDEGDGDAAQPTPLPTNVVLAGRGGVESKVYIGADR